MKKVLIVSLFLFMLVGCGCKNKTQEKQPEHLDIKANFDVAKEIEIDGLKFTNVQLIVDKNGVSNYKAVVVNMTDKVYNLKQINIKIDDKEGKELTTLIGYIGNSLSPGESRNIDISVQRDLMKGYNIEYRIIK